MPESTRLACGAELIKAASRQAVSGEAGIIGAVTPPVSVAHAGQARAALAQDHWRRHRQVHYGRGLQAAISRIQHGVDLMLEAGADFLAIGERHELAPQEQR